MLRKLAEKVVKLEKKTSSSNKIVSDFRSSITLRKKSSRAGLIELISNFTDLILFWMPTGSNRTARRILGGLPSGFGIRKQQCRDPQTKSVFLNTRI